MVNEAKNRLKNKLSRGLALFVVYRILNRPIGGLGGRKALDQSNRASHVRR